MREALRVYDDGRRGMSADAIFEPLRFRNLEVKNRIFRSNIAGRLDDYDGGGTQTRINWELKFARGGVGAILSSWTAVDERGKIVPGFAGIETRRAHPVLARARQARARARLPLHPPARPRRPTAGRADARLRQGPLLDRQARSRCTASRPSGRRGPTWRRSSARSPRQRGAPARPGSTGSRSTAANGYLFTQFLSSAINDREDEYGGPLENRARLLLETVEAIRGEVGHDFHLQVKISTTEHANAFLPWLGKGNTIEDSVQVCRWLEAAGADAIHVSSGSTFPHPENPAGEFSLEDMVRTLRRHALEREEHVPQLPPVPALAGEPGHAEALGARPGRGARALAARRPRRSSGRSRSR